MSKPRVYNYRQHQNQTRSQNTNHFRPKVNVHESETGYKVQLAIPGFSQKDLKITLEDEVLTIASEKTWDKVEGERLTHKEFKVGAFKRSFVLPKSVEDNSIEAKVTNGILEISIAKKAKQVIAVA